MNSVNSTYELVSEFLKQFGWLHDSLVYDITFHGNLRYDLSVTISLRAQDLQDDTVKSVKLILGGVTEFRLAQQVNWATFETSSGAGIAIDGERVFLDLGSPERLTPSDPTSAFSTLPRHRSVEDVRQSEFYLDFTDFIGEAVPLEDIADDHFGDLKEAILGDIRGDGSGRRRDPRFD